MRGDQVFWWGVHLELFLNYARKRGEEIPVDELAADYQAALRAEDPPVPAWRQEQIRMALQVFVRGIEHWRWESDATGRRTPRFRLRCRLEAAAGSRAGPAHLTSSGQARSMGWRGKGGDAIATHSAGQTTVPNTLRIVATAAWKDASNMRRGQRPALQSIGRAAAQRADHPAP